MTKSNSIHDSIFLNFMFALIFMKPDAFISLLRICVLAFILVYSFQIVLYLHLEFFQKVLKQLSAGFTIT